MPTHNRKLPAMSTIKGVLSDPDKTFKKSIFHHRNYSGELEAARYFSGCNIEAAGDYNNNGPIFTQKMKKDDQDHRQPRRSSGGRISLDLPIMRNPITNQQHSNYGLEMHTKKEKKYKQPSSPGGKLASFLNSLFNQTVSKKKSKSTTQSMKDEEESPGGRRRSRRSMSISQFRSSSTTDSKNSLYYSSSRSGFRTPPPFALTPTKICKDLRTHSDDQKQVKSTGLQNHDVLDEKRISTEKYMILGNDQFSEKNTISGDQDPSEDGALSDSSSDLFELENYELRCYSSGLPVYETTHMDSIKRGAPISNVHK